MSALGADMVKRTVVSSSATTFLMSWTACAYEVRPFLMITLYEKATSPAVSGWPSCHFTPGLIFTVQVRPSAEMPPFSLVGSSAARSVIGRPSVPMPNKRS